MCFCFHAGDGIRYSVASRGVGDVCKRRPYSNLAVNQSVILTLPVGPSQEAVTVHKDALVHKGGKIRVYVVRDNKALPRPVTLGISSGSRIAITSGLQANDAGIIRGNERLPPGRAVKIATPNS